MGRYCLIFLAASLVLAARARATDAIVIDGKTDWVILSPKNASATEKFAAEELAKYLHAMSGAEFKIVQEQPGSSHWLVVANNDKVMPPTIPRPDNFPKSKEDDGYSMTGAANAIVLSGKTDRATLHAVYAFLDSVGCRFLSPQLAHYGDSAELIPKRPNISADESMFRPFEPVLKFRKIYVEEGHSHTPENLAQIVEWMPKVGFNTLVVPTNYQGAGRVKWDNFREKVAPECQKRGITIEVGGHGYQNFINAEMEDGKVFKEHPEYFGADAKGERLKVKGRVFCTSNPDAVAYLIKNLLAYVKDRPEIQIYDLWPPDGAKWCECDQCKKLGTPSDRQAILMSQVKEATAKVRPDLRLEMIAYAAALQPPEHAKVDKSILVDFCPIGQQFDRQIFDADAPKNKEYVDGLTAWRKAFDGDISIYSYYRKYAWDSLPVIIPHYMQKDLQWYAKVPVQGVSTYAEPDDWRTYELNHYVLAALAWDVNADVDAIVKKFCDARYGSEAEVAGAALVALEPLTRVYCSVPNIALKPAKDIEDARAGASRVADALKEAEKRAKEPAVKQSLQKLGLMYQYAILDLEIQHLRANNASKDLIPPKVAALHDFVTSHENDGVFLVKDHRLSTERMLKRYGVAGKGE